MTNASVIPSAPLPFGSPRFFQAADARLAWWELGAGTPLLLVHGWPLHAATFRALAPVLATRHRVLLVDLAGLGQSSFDRQTDFRFDAHADRLGAFVDGQLKGEVFDCLASDTGATIARLLAARRPTLRRLGLLNTELPGQRPPWIRTYQALFALGAGHLALTMMAKSPWLLRSPMGFGGCFVEPTRLEGEFRELFVRPLEVSAERREGAMRYLRGIDWETVDSLATLHPTLRCETQLIWGVDDPTFPLRHAKVMARQFNPAAPLDEVANAKLLVHEEQPEAVARAWFRL
jgi:haloalkane dehalogenase